MRGKKIAVIGLGTLGRNLALQLAKIGSEVIAIDSDMERIDEIKDRVTVAVCMNSTNERALRSQNLSMVDRAVVCIGDNLQANILTVVLLKKIGVRHIIARISSDLERDILREIGAHELVFPEEKMARDLAVRLSSDTILELIPLTPRMTAVRMKPPASFLGKTLAELGVRTNYRVNVVAIQKVNQDGEQEEVIPFPDVKITDQQLLLIVGNANDIKKLARVK